MGTILEAEAARPDTQQEDKKRLDSEGYYQPNLQKVFASMERYIPEQDEDSSSFSELDLFLTGTDVDGNIYTLFDDAGHPIDIKDHRSVFLLSHRKGREDKEPCNKGFK